MSTTREDDIMLTIPEAAERRAAGVRAPADRPSQRRASEIGGAGVTRAISAQMTMRESTSSSGLLHFDGHASMYEREYEMWDEYGPYVEVVSAGAGAETLSRADLSCPLVLDHESLRRIAITDNGSLTLTEDDLGLSCVAPSLDPNDMDVRYIQPKMAAGLLSEMSFRFRITSGVWSPDCTQFRITSYDLHRGDVAIVGYGANPFTGSSLREHSAPVVTARTGADLVSAADVAHIR